MTALMVNGLRVRVLDETGPRIGSEQDALDIIGEVYGTDVAVVAVPVSRLAPEFLRLNTRMAGAFIQKLQNYGLRLIVLGDISAAMTSSKALTDFVRETNRIGHHYFAASQSDLEANFGRKG